MISIRESCSKTSQCMTHFLVGAFPCFSFFVHFLMRHEKRRDNRHHRPGRPGSRHGAPLGQIAQQPNRPKISCQPCLLRAGTLRSVLRFFTKRPLGTPSKSVRSCIPTSREGDSTQEINLVSGVNQANSRTERSAPSVERSF